MTGLRRPLPLVRNCGGPSGRARGKTVTALLLRPSDNTTKLWGGCWIRLDRDCHPTTVREFSWFPDSRHIAASSNSASRDTRLLWMFDASSEERKLLTGGLVNERLPTVSLDGRRMLFVESASEFRIVA